MYTDLQEHAGSFTKTRYFQVTIKNRMYQQGPEVLSGIRYGSCNKISEKGSKMKSALYLDDNRTPTENIPGYYPWVIVRNYDEFVKWIDENGVPDLVSFDHDLAEEHMNDYYKQLMNEGFQHPNYGQYKEKTGLDCAKYLVTHCEKNNVPIKSCAVHSHNPVGSYNIQSFINGYKKHTGQPQDCFIHKFPFVVNEKGSN